MVDHQQQARTGHRGSHEPALGQVDQAVDGRSDVRQVRRDLDLDRRGDRLEVLPVAVEPQAEGVVAGGQVGERPSEAVRVEVDRRGDHHGLVPVVRPRQAEAEEPGLNRRQGHGTGGGTILGLRNVLEVRHQLTDRRIGEERADAETQAGPSCPSDDADRQDRVAAQREEVVVEPDAVDAQGTLPDGGDRDLLGGSRGADCRGLGAAGSGRAWWSIFPLGVRVHSSTWT